jgi:uncharacterized membrane protein
MFKEQNRTAGGAPPLGVSGKGAEALKRRVDIIDALRGLSVILMVFHHLFFDLVEFLGAPAWLFSNPVFDVLHYFFAGVFIFLSGLSSQLSRSNVKRGLKVLVIALIITAVTWFMDMQILFGILHLLGFCMVFYGLTRGLWDAIPRAMAPLIYVALLVGSALAVKYLPSANPYIWMFGWFTQGFYSSDYFPIFPWVFVFLSGAWAGYYVKERLLPARFYELKIPLLPAVGRRSLLIYVLHQPVLYGAVTALAHFK